MHSSARDHGDDYLCKTLILLMFTLISFDLQEIHSLHISIPDSDTKSGILIIFDGDFYFHTLLTDRKYRSRMKLLLHYGN